MARVQVGRRQLRGSPGELDVVVAGDVNTGARDPAVRTLAESSGLVLLSRDREPTFRKGAWEGTIDVVLGPESLRHGMYPPPHVMSGLSDHAQVMLVRAPPAPPRT